MSEEKSIIATLVLKAGGMARQRIRLSGRRTLDFTYRRGVGHVVEYTDIEKFHSEESALREIVRLPFNIRTILGEIGAHAKAKGVLAEVIADQGGHRPAKHAKLCELRNLLDVEIARLEREGVGREPEKPKEAAAPQPSPREMAIERRRAHLRRAGEEYTRNIARDYALQIPKLNNYQGMMDAIIEREFPPEEAGSAPVEKSPEASAPVEKGPEAGTEGEPDLSGMSMAQLRKLAKERGVKGQTRNDILSALSGAQPALSS
jgi:hypothetical protein